MIRQSTAVPADINRLIEVIFGGQLAVQLALQRAQSVSFDAVMPDSYIMVGGQLSTSGKRRYTGVVTVSYTDSSATVTEFRLPFNDEGRLQGQADCLQTSKTSQNSKPVIIASYNYEVAVDPAEVDSSYLAKLMRLSIKLIAWLGS